MKEFEKTETITSIKGKKLSKLLNAATIEAIGEGDEETLCICFI